MAASMSNSGLRPETIAAHALKSTDPATGAVVPPIHLASTYARDENYQPLLKENYQRNGNPTLWQAEEAVAALEQGRECLLFPSGMQAIATLIETIPVGGHVVAPDTMYYGTRDWLKRLDGKGRISLTLFSPSDRDGIVPRRLYRLQVFPVSVGAGLGCVCGYPGAVLFYPGGSRVCLV